MAAKGPPTQIRKQLYLDISITSQLTQINQVLVAISLLLDLIKITDLKINKVQNSTWY